MELAALTKTTEQDSPHARLSLILRTTFTSTLLSVLLFHFAYLNTLASLSSRCKYTASYAAVYTFWLE